MSENQTVGQLVAQKPGLSRVFEKHSIDFCCGGGVTIEEACLRKNIDPAPVYRDMAEELKEKQENQTDWTKVRDLTEIINFILEEYHTNLKSELERLDFLARKVARVHGSRHPELLSIEKIWSSLRLELLVHLDKEEQVLFPMMTQIESAVKNNSEPEYLQCETVINPIHQMEFEHESVGTSLFELKRLSDSFRFPDDACNSFRALYDGLQQFSQDLHRHIHLENFVLHPLAADYEIRLRKMAGRAV